MKKINKPIHIALLIFTLLYQSLFIDLSYADTLRVPIDKAVRSRAYINKQADKEGAKNVFARITEELAEKIGYKAIPGSVRFSINDIWSKFIDHHSDIIKKGNALIEKDIACHGKLQDKTLKILENIIMDDLDFEFSDELNAFIGEQTKHIKGEVMVRSCEKWGDRYDRNLAGAFKSFKKKDARYIKQAIGEIFLDAIKKIWIEQNKGDKFMEGVPRILTREEGIGILVQPFLSFTASGIAKSTYCGHSIMETVIGDVSGVHLKAGSVYVRVKKGENRPMFYKSFEDTPYEFTLEGKKYSRKDLSKEDIEDIMIGYPMVRYEYGSYSFSPINEFEASEVNRVINALEEEMGVPINVEWGFFEDGLYIVQVRPIIGEDEEITEISPLLANKKLIAESPVVKGATHKDGFTGKVILFADNITEDMIHNFENLHKEEYIRVQSDVALKIGTSLYKTKAKVLVDPEYGVLTHGTNAIDNRIGKNKDFVHVSGSIIKKVLDENLTFVPYPFCKGVWISEEYVTYFSDGLEGEFYLAGKSSIFSIDGEKKILHDFHTEIADAFYKKIEEDIFTFVCHVIDKIFFGNNMKDKFRSLLQDANTLDVLASVEQDLEHKISEEDLDLIEHYLGFLEEALSYPLYPCAWENELMKNFKKILVLKGIKEALRDRKKRASIMDEYRVVIVDRFRLRTGVIRDIKNKGIKAENILREEFKKDTKELLWRLSEVNYKASFVYVHMHDIPLSEIIVLLKAIRSVNPDAKIYIDGLASKREHFEPFMKQYGAISFIGNMGRILENVELTDAILNDFYTWQEEKKEKEGDKDSTAMKILLVEDQDFLRENMQSTLKTLGYDCDVVKNGDEAVRVDNQKRKSYDLIIYDVQGNSENEGFRYMISSAPFSIINTALHKKDVSDALLEKSLFFWKAWDTEELYKIVNTIYQEDYQKLLKHREKQKEKNKGKRNIFVISNKEVDSMKIHDSLKRKNIDKRYDIFTLSGAVILKLEEKVNTALPDIVIIDENNDPYKVEMLIKIAREHNKDVKFIILSDDVIVLKEQKLGANVLGILDKPFYMKRVVKIIEAQNAEMLPDFKKHKDKGVNI